MADIKVLRMGDNGVGVAEMQTGETIPSSKISGLGTAAASATGDFATAGHTHSYQPLHASLTAVAGVTVTSAGTALLDDADASAQRSTLGLGNVANLLNYLSASAAPTPGDDTGDGYAVGSRWIDTTADKEYVCLDATSTDAVWIETTQSGGGGGGAASSWTTVSASYYTATPASIARITMSNTSNFATGLPVRYTIGGVAKYGQVAAISSNSFIDIRGPSLNSTVTLLEVGRPEFVVQISAFVPGVYGDAVNTDLLLSKADAPIKWLGPTAYLVYFEAIHTVSDSGTQAKVNVHINNAAVSTNDSSLGVQLGAADAWVGNATATISLSYYDINYGEELEIACTAAGSTKDARNLMVQMIFVYA